MTSVVWNTSGNYQQFSGPLPLFTDFNSNESGSGHIDQVTFTVKLSRFPDAYTSYTGNSYSTSDIRITGQFYNGTSWETLTLNNSGTNIMTETYASVTSSTPDANYSENNNLRDSNGTLLDANSQCFAILVEFLDTSPTLTINPDDNVSCYSTQLACFYGFVRVNTISGFKMVSQLVRGDMIETNNGFQPLSQLIRSRIIPSQNKKLIVIPQNFFKNELPLHDLYITTSHPFSFGKCNDDEDYEFIHFFSKNLTNFENIKVSELQELYVYNLVFDKHYEINVEGLKVLSHHPNHYNDNYCLPKECETTTQRSKKIYADFNQTYFQKISLDEIQSDNIIKFLSEKLKF